jgi:formylglycine-generating enzyme required for sulfatase activity
MPSIRTATFAVALVAALMLPATSQAKKCPADSVQVGDVCVDKYEASVWSTTDAATIKKIQKGKIAAAAEIVGTQMGAGGTDDYGAGCPDNAAGCTDYYAVSIPAVLPSGAITQFQAMAACRNAGKHLATNLEWQAAALGTPDPGTDNGTTDCNVLTTTFSLPEDPVNTGSRSGCVSDAGAFDMSGNIGEWVADWVPTSTGCPGWSGFSDDAMCLSGASTTANGPGALLRGGPFLGGTQSGPFFVYGINEPWGGGPAIGFRCARRL